MVGARVRRVEDPRILRGHSEYVDDIAAPDALHVALVRSPYAHARVRSIDPSAALALPGVRAVETAASLGEANGPFPHPTWFPARPALDAAIHSRLRPEVIRLLADGLVRFAGEAVAAVVADDRYLAEDAARRVVVDYEPLPVVVDPETAADPATPVIDPAWGSNVIARFTVRKGDPDAAFAAAAHVVRARVRMHRQTGGPLEPRGVLARPERRGDGLTVWSSTQTPHWLRDALARALPIERNRLRVVAPDVGGGFGTKSMVYPEELLVPALARRHGRPVKWTDTRRENFASAIHSRAQRHDVELALDADGRILGLRDHYLVDCGAANVEALVVLYNTTSHLQGTYAVPALAIECTGVTTNKSPLSAYRGAGRPEAVWAMERILDRAADELGLDRVELRRRNLLPAGAMPHEAGILYRDGTPLVVDGGDFPGLLEDAAAAIDWAGVHARQPAERAAGIYRGVGVAMYLEGTGIGPHEQARVEVHADGTVTVAVALPSQGQGHETVLAQLAADALGVPMDRIRVIAGDTAAIDEGGGTIASRTAVVVGNAVRSAALTVRERALAIAATRLEASVADLRIEGGRIHVAGSPDRGLELGALAGSIAAGVGRRDPSGQGLAATESFDPGPVTFASGAHAAVVAVDPALGSVTVERYLVVHDCGRVINPRIVDGQVHGGVAQGIGAALYEELVYDDAGQLVTGSYLDYGLPRSPDVPAVEVLHRETPSAANPLGIKGVGEAGTIAVPAAIAAAIEDALAPFGVRLETCPMTPERIRDAIDAGRAAGSVRPA